MDRGSSLLLASILLPSLLTFVSFRLLGLSLPPLIIFMLLLLSVLPSLLHSAPPCLSQLRERSLGPHSDEVSAVTLQVQSWNSILILISLAVSFGLKGRMKPHKRQNVRIENSPLTVLPCLVLPPRFMTPNDVMPTCLGWSFQLITWCSFKERCFQIHGCEFRQNVQDYRSENLLRPPLLWKTKMRSQKWLTLH